MGFAIVARKSPSRITGGRWHASYRWTFDTSAVVPLIIDEGSTDRSNRVWNESSRIVCARSLYPETRAAAGPHHTHHRLNTRRGVRTSLATTEDFNLAIETPTLPCSREPAVCGESLYRDRRTGLRAVN